MCVSITPVSDYEFIWVYVFVYPWHAVFMCQYLWEHKGRVCQHVHVCDLQAEFLYIKEYATRTKQYRMMLENQQKKK